MAQFMPVVDLNDLWEYHDANATTSPNGKEYGPTFAISGVVDYIDYDGKEAPSFIEGGFKHSLTISSNSLRRNNPDASLWVEVTRYLVEKHQALKSSQSRWLETLCSWFKSMDCCSSTNMECN